MPHSSPNLRGVPPLVQAPGRVVQRAGPRAWKAAAVIRLRGALPANRPRGRCAGHPAQVALLPSSRAFPAVPMLGGQVGGAGTRVGGPGIRTGGAGIPAGTRGGRAGALVRGVAGSWAGSVAALGAGRRLASMGSVAELASPGDADGRGGTGARTSAAMRRNVGRRTSVGRRAKATRAEANARASTETQAPPADQSLRRGHSASITAPAVSPARADTGTTTALA